MSRKFIKNKGSEINLRSHFDKLLYGPGIKHSYLVGIRHMKKSLSGELTKCSCVNKLTHEAYFDCSFCKGEGYLWDEKIYRTFSSFVGADGGKANRTRRISPGEIRTDYKIFYFRYDTKLSYKDKIIEFGLDEEGVIKNPVVRETIYTIETIQDYRSDNGRIEYYAVYCREESSIRPNK